MEVGIQVIYHAKLDILELYAILVISTTQEEMVIICMNLISVESAENLGIYI